jgi:hypothetical protein
LLARRISRVPACARADGENRTLAVAELWTRHGPPFVARNGLRRSYCCAAVFDVGALRDRSELRQEFLSMTV